MSERIGYMKDHRNLTMVMLAGGAVALALRLWQTLTVFEVNTGLAVAGYFL